MFICWFDISILYDCAVSGLLLVVSDDTTQLIEVNITVSAELRLYSLPCMLIAIFGGCNLYATFLISDLSCILALLQSDSADTVHLKDKEAHTDTQASLKATSQARIAPEIIDQFV